MRYFLSLLLLNIYVVNSFSFYKNSVKERNPLLVVSLDGVQAAKFDQFLKENPNSTFNSIIQSGVKAEYMK